jgi:hypothetical protein
VPEHERSHRRLSAIVRLPNEISPGVIEVERLTEPEPISGVAGPWYGPGPY